jgi:hypothetical protein
MTTYYYPTDTYFGGAFTVGPADEIVDFHGSGVSIDLFGTAISSTLLYTASEFAAASEGHGGTLITFTSATTATGGHGHGSTIASPVTS